MLEILILIALAKRIGKIVEAKGRKKGGYQFLLVGLWIGGEIFGGIVGGILAAISFDESEGTENLLIYGFAIGGAIVGAILAFVIAKSVAPLDGYEAGPPLAEADVEGWRQRFTPSDTAPRLPDDAYSNTPERAQRPLDDRMQH